MNTRRISPQFHVIHNKLFETTDLQNKIKTKLKRLVNFTIVAKGALMDIHPTQTLSNNTPQPVTLQALSQNPDEYLTLPESFTPGPLELVEHKEQSLRRSTRTRNPTKSILQSRA